MTCRAGTRRGHDAGLRESRARLAEAARHSHELAPALRGAGGLLPELSGHLANRTSRLFEA